MEMKGRGEKMEGKTRLVKKRKGKSEEGKEVYETGRTRVERKKKECENGRKEGKRIKDALKRKERRKEDKRCVKKEGKKERG